MHVIPLLFVSVFVLGVLVLVLVLVIPINYLATAVHKVCLQYDYKMRVSI